MFTLVGLRNRFSKESPREQTTGDTGIPAALAARQQQALPPKPPRPPSYLGSFALPQPHLVSILAILTTVVGLLNVADSYKFFNSGALQVYFSSMSPHFYLTRKLFAFLLPTRYSETFQEAAPLLITAKGVAILKVASSAAVAAHIYPLISIVAYLLSFAFLLCNERAIYSDAEVFLVGLLALLTLSTLSVPRAWCLPCLKWQASIPFVYQFILIYLGGLGVTRPTVREWGPSLLLALLPLLPSTWLALLRFSAFAHTASQHQYTSSPFLYLVAQAAASVLFCGRATLEDLDRSLGDTWEDTRDSLRELMPAGGASSTLRKAEEEAEEGSGKKKKKKKGGLDVSLLVALCYGGLVVQSVVVTFLWTAIHPCLLSPDPLFKYTSLPMPLSELIGGGEGICEGESLLEVVQTQYNVDGEPSPYSVDLYASPLTMDQVSGMRTDPNYALQLGQMSGKATASEGRIEGEQVGVAVSYFRSYGRGSRVFFRANRGKVELGSVDNFLGSREWYEEEGGWLSELPTLGGIHEARGKAGTVMGGDRGGTCFALAEGDFLDFKLPRQEDAMNAKEAAVAGMCAREDVGVVVASGKWGIAAAGGEPFELGEGEEGVLKRGGWYRLVVGGSEYKEVAVLCIKHECESGGFDVQTGRLSESGWKALWGGEQEKSKMATGKSTVVRQTFTREDGLEF